MPRSRLTERRPCLDRGLVLWRNRAGRDNGRFIVFRHFLVGTVEDQLRAGVLNDRNLCSVRRKGPGDAFKVAVRMDVRLDPAGGFHVRKCLCLAVHTAREAGDKDICGDRLPGDAVSNSQGAAGPVHFHEFAGFPADPQCCLFGRGISMVLFIELGVLIGDCPGSFVFRAVICPQEREGHVGLRKFIINSIHNPACFPSLRVRSGYRICSRSRLVRVAGTGQDSPLS